MDKQEHELSQEEVEEIFPNNRCFNKWIYTDEIECDITKKVFSRKKGCQDKDCPKIQEYLKKRKK